MIFVTVGTHEQAFDRLLQKMDELRRDKIITEEVRIQSGYTTYEPQHCKWKKLIPYESMVRNVKAARIVITHGGPASFMMPLQEGKIPIVVPRRAEFSEHINNHQVEFARAVKERYGNIIPVYDIEELGKLICEYDKIVAEMKSDVVSNNAAFNEKLEREVQGLFGKV